MRLNRTKSLLDLAYRLIISGRDSVNFRLSATITS